MFECFCVVAEQIGAENSKNSLLPANTFSGFRLKALSTKLFKVTRTSHFTVTFLVGDSQAAGYPGRIYLGALARDTNGSIKTSIKSILQSSVYHKIKYRLNADNTIDVVLYRTQYSPVVGCFILSGNGYVSNLCSDVSDSEIDDTFIDFTEV